MTEEIKKSTVEEFTPEEISQAKSMGLSYYKLSSVMVGEPVELDITGLSKVRGGKYTLPKKDYSMRVALGTGQVMDVTSGPVAGALHRIGYKKGTEFTPFSVKITRKQTNKIGESPYIVEEVTKS